MFNINIGWGRGNIQKIVVDFEISFLQMLRYCWLNELKSHKKVTSIIITYWWWQAKLFLCLICHEGIYGSRWIAPCINKPLDKTVLSCMSPILKPRETASNTHQTEGWVRPKASLDSPKAKISYLCQELNSPISAVVEPAVSVPYWKEYPDFS